MRTLKAGKPESTIITTLIFLLLLISCRNQPSTIPFPKDQNEFAPPEVFPLQFSEEKKIDWIPKDTGFQKAPEIRKADLEKIPSRPFYPEGFLPINKPTQIFPSWSSVIC